MTEILSKMTSKYFKNYDKNVYLYKKKKKILPDIPIICYGVYQIGHFINKTLKFI